MKQNIHNRSVDHDACVDEIMSRHIIEHYAQHDIPVTCRVVFEYVNECVRMYSARVQFTGEIRCDELLSIAHVTNMFTMRDDAGVQVDDLRYVAGDGDDSLAVEFIAGTAMIWIRAFSHTND